MLLELSVVFGTYASLRLFKKFEIKKNKALTQKTNQRLTTSKTPVPLNKKYKQDLNIALISLGTAILQPVFLPHLSLINAVLLGYSSYPYMIGAEKSLRIKRFNNDVIGAGWTIFAVGSRQYFAAAFGNIIYHIGANFIEKTRDHSRQSIVHIFDKQNREVWLLKDNIEIETPLSNVLPNDIVVVNSGGMIPVDGKIISGLARIDEHILTGESQTIEKSAGEMVFASTLLISGTIHIEVEKAGNDTVVAKIEKVLNQTTDFKNTIQLKGEEWADKSAPYFLGASGLAALTLGFSAAAAILTASFGYQIRMVAPLSTLRYLSQASKSGILIKDGRSLERLNDVDTVLFDKTGTLTEEQPQVGQVICWGKYTSEQILRFAATAEIKLKHPIAKAILQAYTSYNNELDDIDDAHYEIGFGTKVYLKQQVIRVGSLRFMQNEGLQWDEEKQAALEPVYQQGHSIVMVGIDDNIVGAIEIEPVIRPEIVQLVNNLKQKGIKHIMIVSGDHKKPTHQLAKKLGITEYFAEVLPENKAQIVSELQQQRRKVCFIGDGINDAIAMKQADVSISLKGASTIATDTADIILMNGDLTHLYPLFNIAGGLDNVMKKSAVLVLVPTGLILIGSISFHLGLLAALIIKQGFLGANILYVLKSTEE